MSCFDSHLISNDARTTGRVPRENLKKTCHTTSSNRSWMKFIPRLSAGGYKSTNLADQYELNDRFPDEHVDGREIDFCKITFGCNQTFPTVAMSPPTYCRTSLKAHSISGHHEQWAASSYLIDIAPPPRRSGSPRRSKNAPKMFGSSDKRRGFKHSTFASDLNPKAKSPAKLPSSAPMSSSEFDAMLRSNHTIYVQGVNTDTSMASYDSREVLYSNIPLSSSQNQGHR